MVRLACALLLCATTAYADMWEEFKNPPPSLTCVDLPDLIDDTDRRRYHYAVLNEVYDWRDRNFRRVRSSAAIRIPRDTYFCREEGPDFVCEPRELMRFHDSRIEHRIDCTKPTPTNPTGCQ